MSYIVDRRLNGKNKSTVNRQRFLRRYRKHIKKAVDEAEHEKELAIEQSEKEQHKAEVEAQKTCLHKLLQSAHENRGKQPNRRNWPVLIWLRWRLNPMP